MTLTSGSLPVYDEQGFLLGRMHWIRQVNDDWFTTGIFVVSEGLISKSLIDVAQYTPATIPINWMTMG